MALNYYSRYLIFKNLTNKGTKLSLTQNINYSRLELKKLLSCFAGYHKRQYISNIFYEKVHINSVRSIHSLVEDKRKSKRLLQNVDTSSDRINKEKSPKNFTYKIIKDVKYKFGHIEENGYFRHDDVEISVDGNPKLKFSLTWLRHSCRCDQCLHQHSRQRMSDLTKYGRTSFQIKTCNSVDHRDKTKEIHINWIDGHQSKFDLHWLQEVAKSCESFGSYLDSTNLNDKQSRLLIPQDDYYAIVGQDRESNKNFWTGEQIVHLLKPVQYADLIDKEHGDNEAIYSLIKQLYRYGIAKIINVPTERDQLLQVARRLAYDRPTGYGTTFDVIAEPSDRILAYTAKEFDLHCDLPYRESLPGTQMLHCLINSEQDGESYFCDSFNACEQLKEQNMYYYNILSRLPVTFSVIDPYREVKLRQYWPIITKNYLGQLDRVHHSPFMLPPLGRVDQIKLFYEAYHQFSKYLHSNANKFITKMSPGDLYIFQNGRVLHGRNHYDPHKSKRFLQGCYMDWDEIEALYEKFYL